MKIVIFDEADEIMARGFYDQIKEIVLWMPIDIILCVASATRGGI